MPWPCEPRRVSELGSHVLFLTRVRVVQAPDRACTCVRCGTLVFGQHREQTRKGCTMPRKKGLPVQKMCGQCKESMMNAAFTEKEWRKAEARDRVCRACMDAVRANAGVSGQTGRLPKGAKDALLSVALSTSLHSPHRSPVLTRKTAGTTPHRGTTCRRAVRPSWRFWRGPTQRGLEPQSSGSPRRSLPGQRLNTTSRRSYQPASKFCSSSKTTSTRTRFSSPSPVHSDRPGSTTVRHCSCKHWSILLYKPCTGPSYYYCVFEIHLFTPPTTRETAF